MRVDPGLLDGFSAADLARACREANLTVRGFSKRLELAPLPLLVSEIYKAISRGDPKGQAVVVRLARNWVARNPAMAAELKEMLPQLASASPEEVVRWTHQLGSRYGRASAIQAVFLSGAALAPADSPLRDPRVVMQIIGSWPEDEQAGPRSAVDEAAATLEEVEAGEPLEQVAGPPPDQLADLAPGEPGDQAAQQGEQATTAPPAAPRKHRGMDPRAAQIKSLQQMVKRQKEEIQALQRQLKAAHDREAALVQSLAELKAYREVYEAAVHETEPRARIHRLVQALFEALREGEELKQEVARLRGLI